MITKAQYFGSKEHSIEQEANADWLLAQVNCLLHEAVEKGVYDYEIDPDTSTQISGSKGGQGDGGFRLPTSGTGASTSSHKEAKGVDVYDPDNKLDDWITDSILTKYNLYREHPDWTPTWCHLTTRAPKSKRRTFIP